MLLLFFSYCYHRQTAMVFVTENTIFIENLLSNYKYYTYN